MKLQGKRALVVGLGESGKAAVRFLCERGALVSATDQRPKEEFAEVIQSLQGQGVHFYMGAHREPLFLEQDLIIPSPGVPWDLPPLAAARRRGICVAGELELAASFLKGPVIGITGTNGKTTTTSLIGHILTSAGCKARTGGNIGTPVLSLVDDSTDDTWNVLELSSFQLEATQTFRSHIAVVLNVTPDHLDRHGTFDAYLAAKTHIVNAQTPQDRLVLNADDEVCRRMAEGARSQVFWFSRTGPVKRGAWVQGEQVLFSGSAISDTRLPIRGAHNLENALAAVTAAALAGVAKEAIGAALHSFAPVEHRLEFVRSLNGVDYYNDSKATNVAATVRAIEAFDAGVWVILGGYDKGAEYTDLTGPLRARARGALLIGASAQKMEGQLDGSVPLYRAGTLERAVACARQKAQPGDTVLLAPACASFDQFENYGHRGRVFKKLVGELTEARP